MKFYVIMASLNPGLTITDVQNFLTAWSINYYRIAPNVWLVASSFSADMLAELLKPLTTPGGNLFVTRVDPTDKGGMMVPDVWAWIRNNGGGP